LPVAPLHRAIQHRLRIVHDEFSRTPTVQWGCSFCADGQCARAHNAVNLSQPVNSEPDSRPKEAVVPARALMRVVVLTTKRLRCSRDRFLVQSVAIWRIEAAAGGIAAAAGSTDARARIGPSISVRRRSDRGGIAHMRVPPPPRRRLFETSDGG
jgi:hypothetical protein